MTAYSALWLRGARRLRPGHGALVREPPRAPQRAESTTSYLLRTQSFPDVFLVRRHIHTNIFAQKHPMSVCTPKAFRTRKGIGERAAGAALDDGARYGPGGRKNITAGGMVERRKRWSASVWRRRRARARLVGRQV